MRVSRLLITTCLTLTACGRVGFDELATGSGDALSITAATPTTNVLTHVDVTAAGGTPPYTFSATGAGTIDASTGRFLSARTTGAAIVTVKDAVGSTASTSITSFADAMFYVGGRVNVAARPEVWRTNDGINWSIV